MSVFGFQSFLSFLFVFTINKFGSVRHCCFSIFFLSLRILLRFLYNSKIAVIFIQWYRFYGFEFVPVRVKCVNIFNHIEIVSLHTHSTHTTPSTNTDQNQTLFTLRLGRVHLCAQSAVLPRNSPIATHFYNRYILRKITKKKTKNEKCSFFRVSVWRHQLDSIWYTNEISKYWSKHMWNLPRFSN